MEGSLEERDDLIEKGIARIESKFLPKESRRQRKKHPRWRQWKGHGPKLPTFFPSESDACRRQLCYALLDYEPEPEDAHSAMRLHDGTFHGETIIFWLKKMGFRIRDIERSCAKKVKFGGVTFIMSGRIDGMIWTGRKKDESSQAILENKGLSTYTMNRHEMDIVNSTYRRQGQLYMWALKVKRCLFAIKDKNTSKIRLWELGFNKSVVRQVLRRWKQVVEAVEDGKLLDRDYEWDGTGKKPLKCEWCRFNERCWEK